MTVLTPKQEKFAQHYALHQNATEAYRAAGYSTRGKPATINRKAIEVLQNGEVTARIEVLNGKITARAEQKFNITVDRVLEELAKVGFSNLLDYVDVDPSNGLPHVNLNRITRAQGGAIASVKVKTYPERDQDGEFEIVKEVEFKAWDKIAALAHIGRHLKMFTDKIEATGKDGGAIIVGLNPKHAGL